MDLNIDFCVEVSDAVVHEANAAAMEGSRGIVLRDCLTVNYDRLHRRLLRYLGCPDLASDCLHDAWLRLGDMTVPAAVQRPEAYVYRVACNVAIDLFRGHWSRQYRGDADVELDTIADPSPGPDCIAEARSDVEAVDRAMQHLPHRHQAILMALRIEQLTRLEVATHYGISLRRVDTVLRQALDYCAQQTNQPVMAGVRGTRRALLQERMCLNSSVNSDVNFHIPSSRFGHHSPGRGD